MQTTARSAPDLIGRTLGKFTVVDRLGKGGSGEVFRAEQVQLGRSAVIKVLRREMASAPNRIDRFLREARLASRLDHPYAAHVYAFGAEPDGVLWIAMEHVKGITLDELVTLRGAMPMSVFAPLFARLCEVVHTAHELGIVHRDIKGSNVMVIERAGQLLPKLLDFGIAKADDGETSPGLTAGVLTSHGATLGSPQYMSPEQWQRPSEVDGRADIYALGVLAYRCVAGVLPFNSQSRKVLADAHVHQQPPPLPDAVPPALGDAILRALEKDPNRRWQSAMGFAEALRRAGGAGPPETVPIFDPIARDAWLRGPQPIADAVAHLTSATTTVEVDAALRELVAITCRWLAVLALSGLPPTAGTGADPSVREHARGVIGRDDGAPWLKLARAAIAACPSPLPHLATALAGTDLLVQLADRLDDRDRARTAAGLAADVAAASEALAPLEPLLAYQLVLGRSDGAESWQGPRRRDRERVVVWGEPLGDGEVALLDTGARVVARLSPLAQVVRPLPSAEPELFLLWRGGRGPARLVAAPWGFERDDDAAGQRLAALSTEDSDTAADPATERSPWVGLAAYGADDADHFVGREREVETLANRLVRAPLLAVLGPSGVGKSSFVHAGLVPRLGEHYRVLAMRPGRHPMHALAALPPVSGDSHDESALVARLHELGESAQRGLVLVIDQLEELVTLCGDPDERRRFAETIAQVADGPGAPARVIATLRDDFATVIESESALRGKFEVFVLATPPPEALRRIVTEPARRMAVTVEPRVVDDIVAEVAGRPASLPLLSFTASQLWATRDRTGRKIAHDAYVEIGGVAGALATYADEVYATLARGDQDCVRDLFARLVAADGTRIPSPRSELEQLPHARRVLGHLIDARLLVVRDDEGNDVVEIVHECLAERWPRLARWRSEDAADRELLGDVRAAARRWQDAGRRADLLWRGEALAELRKLSARSAALTELERAFADEATRAEQSARRIRRGIVGGVMIVLAAAAAVMAYLGVVANHNRSAAEHSASQARDAAQLAEDRLTQSLIAQGRRELNDGRALQSLAYFAEAMKRGADSVGLREMVSIANRGRAAERAVIAGDDIANLVALHDGFAVGNRGGRVDWYTPDGKRAGTVETGFQMLSALLPGPDEGVIATGNKSVAVMDRQRHVIATVPTAVGPWSAHVGPGSDEVAVVERDRLVIYGFDGKERRSMKLSMAQMSAWPLFDAGSHHMLWDDTRRLMVVDLATMQQKQVSEHFYGIPVISGDGTLAAYIDVDRHKIHVIAPDGTELRTIVPAVHETGVAMSETGDRIAAVGDTELAVYDRDGKLLGGHPVVLGDGITVLKDRDEWIAGLDGTIRHYHADQLVSSRPGHVTPVDQLVLAGDAIASLGTDSTVVVARADEAEVQFGAEPCRASGFNPTGVAMTFQCLDATQRVFVGSKHITTITGPDNVELVAIDPASRRAAVWVGLAIQVYGADGALLGKRVAETPGGLGAPVFIDENHLYLSEMGKAVWTWTLPDHLEKLADVAGAALVAPTATGALVDTATGDLVALEHGKEVRRLSLGEHADHLVLSPDRRWLAAETMAGSVAIVDTATDQLVRRLETVGSTGAPSSFDATGDLLARPTRGSITIWDRTTGDQLVGNLDLLRDMTAAWFLPDGRLELMSSVPALLDIPRDTRATADIVREIACRVPLRASAGRVEPATPTCR